jgi:elongator complex protein 3
MSITTYSHINSIKNNFGMPQSDIEEIVSILPKRRKMDTITQLKIVCILLEMDTISCISDLGETIKVLSKKHKYHQRSKKEISKVFFRDMLWPLWCKSENPYKNYNNKNSNLIKILKSTSVRGASGITNITILTEVLDSCEFNCYFCPDPPKTGPLKAARSYLIFEPAVGRGAKVGFNLIEQIRTRVRDLVISGVLERIFKDNNCVTIGKIEVRLAGGTFSSYKVEDQDRFIQWVYYAVRTIDFLDNEMPEMMRLEEERDFHINTNEGLRIVGFSVETRPDKIDLQTLKRFNNYCLTWVEIGCQTHDDNILKKVNRGHTFQDSKNAVAMIKGVMGAKVLTHWMQDMPGSNPDIDLETFKDEIIKNKKWFPNKIIFCILCVSFVFDNNILHYLCFILIFITVKLTYKPSKVIYSLPHLSDHIKIYPCMRLPYTVIQKWKTNKWDPYIEKENGENLMNVLCEIHTNLPPWIRIGRMIRDFEKSSEKNLGLGYTSETLKSNMGQLVKDKLKNVNLQEIKSREVRNEFLDHGERVYKFNTYECSIDTPYSATEHFISIEAPNSNKVYKLFGLLRLRLPKNKSPIKEVSDHAIIRQIQIYGQFKPVNQKTNLNSNVVQHRGYGKFLIKLAETIAFVNGYRTIIVISAPGTMNYYKKFGYKLNGRYPTKKLTYVNFLKNISKVLPTLMVY